MYLKKIKGMILQDIPKYASKSNSHNFTNPSKLVSGKVFRTKVIRLEVQRKGQHKFHGIRGRGLGESLANSLKILEKLVVSL